MDRNEKIWNHSNTGTKMHAFLNGKALCRSSITRSEDASDYVGRNLVIACCAACEKKFNAMHDRAEASMKPATEAHDLGYVHVADEREETPAEVAARQVRQAVTFYEQSSALKADMIGSECARKAQAEADRTHHHNALGGQRYIPGRGWTNTCRVCQAPEGEGDHFHNPQAPRRPATPEGETQFEMVESGTKILVSFAEGIEMIEACMTGGELSSHVRYMRTGGGVDDILFNDGHRVTYRLVRTKPADHVA